MHIDIFLTYACTLILIYPCVMKHAHMHAGKNKYFDIMLGSLLYS